MYNLDPKTEKYITSIKKLGDTRIEQCSIEIDNSKGLTKKWLRIHYSLAIIGSLSSGISTILAFSDLDKYVTGTFALVGTLCISIQTLIKPSQKAIMFNRAKVRYRLLKDRMLIFNESLEVNELTIEEINEYNAEFAEEFADIEESCTSIDENGY